MPKQITQFCFHKQRGINDCGIACLRMICSHFGITKPFFSDEFDEKLSSKGISLFTLTGIATSYGIECKVQKGTFDEFITTIPLPCIVWWHGIHYVVVYEIAEQFIKIADPAMGLLELSIHQFQQSWFLPNTTEGVVISCSQKGL